MRTYRDYRFRDAVFRISCEQFNAVTGEIVRQRRILEDYICRHPEFAKSFEPVDVYADAPMVAVLMADAARLVGVGPMAAVAGVMAELAGAAGLAAGAGEAIVDNGGDIYLSVTTRAIVGLYAGEAGIGRRLAFAVEPADTPLAVCSSSGRMGHSVSLGECDLATVVAKSAALADAAATLAANLVKAVDDVDRALDAIHRIAGVEGVLIAKGDRVGVAGRLPQLVRVGAPGSP